MSYFFRARRQLKCEDNELMREIAETFLGKRESRKRVWGNFRIENDKLIYKSTELCELRNYNKEHFEKEVKKLSKLLKNNTVKMDSKNMELFESAKASPKNYTGYIIRYSATLENVIAVRLPNGSFLGNSAVLPDVGKTVAYGNVDHNTKETVIQRILSEIIPMVPFNALQEAGLDINTFTVIQEGSPETVEVKERRRNQQTGKNEDVYNKQHFTGAKLFKLGTGKETTHYLFDIDRNEIKHGIFNAFLVKLPEKSMTIKEAYESLKPVLVIEAEKKGLKVKRQGEWFFIPTDLVPYTKLNDSELALAALGRRMWDLERTFKSLGLNKNQSKELITKAQAASNKVPNRIRLKAGNNRPNIAGCGIQKDGIWYVKGVISHSGREHKDLNLKTWHYATTNRATESFTILGDVD